MRKTTFALGIVAAIPLGLILSAPVMWRDSTRQVAIAAPVPAPVARHQLVGFGCGPTHATLLAAEEDEFPSRCQAIERFDRACTYDGHQLTLAECDALLGGEGWGESPAALPRSHS